MKKYRFIISIVIIFFSALVTNIYSQNPNEIRLHYGIYDNKFTMVELELIGGANHIIIIYDEFGLKYLKSISHNLQLGVGLNYTKLNIKVSTIGYSHLDPPLFKKMEIISIPICANITFLKYLFINAGPTVDFCSFENSFYLQSGIGFRIGIGAKYELKKFVIFVNSNYKKYAIIPFEKINDHRQLNETGIRFGIGFKL